MVWFTGFIVYPTLRKQKYYFCIKSWVVLIVMFQKLLNTWPKNAECAVKLNSLKNVYKNKMIVFIWYDKLE